MVEFLTGVATALWLGILTAIHPCPLATNVVAVSYIGRQVGSTGRVLAAGLLYTAARSLTYVALSAAAISAVLSREVVSHFLQVHLNRALGPLLILTGMVLTDLIRLPAGRGGVSDRTQRRADRGGLWGAAVLGVLFALSFCPPVAFVFFGTFIPVAARYQSRLLLPAAYGIGTGLPVLVFAWLLAVSAASVGRAFDAVKRIERWARPVTGTVFILVGIYFCLAFIFRVL